MEYQEKMVLQIIKKLTDIDEAPCKKKVQKLVYLLEQKGVDLGYDYKIYIYGPYSEDLDYTICSLKAEHALDIKYSNHGHILECNRDIAVTDIANEILDVLDKFGKRTAMDLELITTALFAERTLNTSCEYNIIDAVKKIKKNKFSDEQILGAVQLLKKEKYICS